MNAEPHKIAVVGIGKIARDQHLPSIAGNPAFELTASVSRNASVEGIDHFRTLPELLEKRPDVTAIALCTPPQVRYEQASQAIAAGRHVLLEKPPGATVSEVESLKKQAAEAGVTLFATWHSRFGPAVAKTKSLLSDRVIRTVKIEWKEDVRRWHPGQIWIWEAGGLGVLDPGINALSILTDILPFPVHLVSGTLEVPANCDSPIAAELRFSGKSGCDVHAVFDWRQTGPQTWNIGIETEDSVMLLSDGGAKLSIGGETVAEGVPAEYEHIYARFADLLAARSSDVDLEPLRQVADAFMLGRRISTEAFAE